MPAPKKITKEAILSAAAAVLREDGFDAVNARSVARRLGCSTQPIYLEFKNMEDLKDALQGIAREIYTSYLKSYMDDQCLTPYHAFGMGFIRFAREEVHLFRYLFVRNRFGINDIDDVNLTEILHTMCRDYKGFTMEIAADFHRDMTIFCYGLGQMISSGYFSMDDDTIADRLRVQFVSLCGFYLDEPTFIRLKNDILTRMKK